MVPAIIMQPHENIYYLVKTPAGSMYRRNRRFLRKTNEAPQPEMLTSPQYEVSKYEPLQEKTPVLKSDDVQSGENPGTGISPRSPSNLNHMCPGQGEPFKQKSFPLCKTLENRMFTWIINTQIISVYVYC